MTRIFAIVSHVAADRKLATLVMFADFGLQRVIRSDPPREIFALALRSHLDACTILPRRQ
jgi:hypothetical protein